MKHRPEIDGLRAVAVLSVVLYHAGLPWMPGGFTGVDVFFVISGYLITRIILSELADGSFSFRRFFERRIRRLLPALFLMLLATSLVACLIMTPTDLMSFAKDLAGGTLFVANMVFWARSENYFAAAPDLNVLLHLWSLAIEEQFYLLFPVALVLARRVTPQRLLAALLVVSIVSLVLAQRSVLRGSPGAFYLLPYRAWELLTGALLAIGIPFSGTTRVREVASAGGLAAIVLAVATYSSATPFPGIAALAPCLGTAAIIWACGPAQTWTGRLLAAPLLQYVGRVSYGFYLYHWPLLAFARYMAMRPLAPMEGLALVAIAFVLSAMSLVLVEQPVRHGRSTAWARSSFVLAGVGALLFGAIATVIIISGGFARSFDPRARVIEQFLIADMQPAYRGGTCFLQLEYDFGRYDIEACATPRPGTVSIALWGDSLAAHFYPGFRAVMGDTVSVLQFTGASCPPLLGYADRFPHRCGALNDFFFRRIEQLKPAVVVLSTRWAQYLKHQPLLDSTIDRLREVGASVVILGPGPSFTTAVPRLVARQMARGAAGMDFRPYENPVARTADAVLKQRFGGDVRVRYVSVLQAACVGGCPAMAGAVPSFIDTDHMTEEGSALYARRVIDQILTDRPSLAR